MLSIVVLLLASLYHAQQALAAPRVIQIKPQERLEVQCDGPVTTTVVSTVTVYDTSPAAQQTAAQTTTEATTSSTQVPTTTTRTATSETGSQSSPFPPPDQNSGNSTGTYRNVLYFTNWGIYGANFQPQQLPISQVSHVLFAFADIGPDGEVKTSDSYADLQKHYPTDSWNDVGNNVYGCVKQLFLLKKKNRGLKVLLSIGGWTYSPKFPPMAATGAGRAKFASSVVKLVQDWGLDGVDIDWEYPANAAEAQNFVLLLKTTRKALDEYAARYAPGYHFNITVACPAGPSHYGVMDLEGMDPLVDGWNLMAYDYAGSWDTTSGHQANLFHSSANPTATKFNTEEAVLAYMARGVPSRKIALGLPLYGRAFVGTAGPGQPYDGVGPGSVQAGVWLYRDLPRAGATVRYDSEVGTSWSYDAAMREMISYDSPASVRDKAAYLKSKGLGGALFWEASGDKTGADSLVGSMAGLLGSLDQSQNLLTYPVSQYDNVRAGMP